MNMVKKSRSLPVVEDDAPAEVPIKRLKDDAGWRLPAVEDDARVEVANGRKIVTITTGGITVSRVIPPRQPGDRRTAGNYLGSRFGTIARRAAGKDDFGFGGTDGDGPLW